MPPHSTLIRLAGRDALDLLHRISTQHLRELPAGHCRTTLFCDFRGRVQHRAVVAHGSDGSAWLVRHDAPPAELLALVDRQIFRDQVRLEDLSDGAVPAATAAAPGSTPGTIVERDGRPLTLCLDGGVDLVLDGAPSPLTEPARIALGFPRHGHEVRDDFNPFEIGLARDIHLDKGCFTGQESLLRMMTYRGVRRRLVRLDGDGRGPDAGEALKRGADDVGVVTSVAAGGAAWVTLAVLKRDVAETDALVSASGVPVGRVTPFEEMRPAGLPDSSPAAS